MTRRRVLFITHPDVVIDPAVPVPDWPLSPRGRDRVVAALRQDWMRGIGAVWSSPERKARDGAALIGSHLGLEPVVLDGLRENDRSSTGYLERAEFEAVATLFFRHPAQNVRGWERAVDAQTRIVAAVQAVCAAERADTIAIVSHGGVGALMLAHLLRAPISRTHDQPGPTGGNVFAFAAGTGEVLHGWRPIDVA